MNRMVVCVGLYLFLCSWQVLYALATVGGVSGLIRVPTAEALHYKEINISYDYVFTNLEERGDYHYAVNLGTFKSVELGFSGGAELEEGVLVNGKYYLMSNESRYPVSIATGFEKLGLRSGSSIYMVASKIFEGGFSTHLGFRAEFSDVISPSLMGGVQYFLTNELALLTDIHELEGDYTANVGALIYVLDALVFRAAILDLKDVGEQGLSFSLGIVFSKYL